MREVLNINKGDEKYPSISKQLCSTTAEMSSVVFPSLIKPTVCVSSTQPGYLDLTPEQAKRLIRTDPIQDYYDVDDEPFARGKYATVRRCKHRTTGKQFAAKFLRKRRRSADLRAEIIHEIAVLEACKQSTRIVRLHEVFESAQDMILLLELACGGELQMLLDKDEVPTERQVVRLMRQILDGLIDLHSIDVAHLDIKPQNLVLTGEFPDCDVKLCDFGISRYLSQGVDVREILGTPDYVAPEVLNYEPISLATDMWSVGVLLYVLLTGCSPFGGDTKQETFCNIAQCRLDFPDDLFEDISGEAKDLMRKLMVKNPRERYTAQQCLQHRWFNIPHESKSLLHSTSLATLATTPRTPTLSKRPAPTLEHSEERSLSLDEQSLDSKSSTSTLINETTKNINDKLVIEKACINEEIPVDNNINNTNSFNNNSKGLTEERRKSFRRNMKELVERLECESDESNISHVIENDNNNCDKNDVDNNNLQPVETDNSSSKLETDLNTRVNKISETVWSNVDSKANHINEDPSLNIMESETNSSLINAPMKLTRSNSYRSVTRANGMQTMPVSRVLQYKFDRPCNVFNSSLSTSPSRQHQNFIFHHDSNEHRDNYRNESIFKFRRVFILDDTEDNLSPPPSINGSLSSENSSMSDSNSDSISEMSIDSSSDRSSVISLDDSFDFVCSRNLSHSRHYSSCYNVWEAVKNQNTMMASTSSRFCPRECTGSIARALSKFTTSSHDINEYKEGNFHRQRKSLTIFNNNAVVSSKISMSKTLTTLSTVTNKKCVGLELTREKNSNVVVIREVKAVHGSKFPRCSEVKCESVQARIRRLQIQNGLQTELAKQRFDIF